MSEGSRVQIPSCECFVARLATVADGLTTRSLALPLSELHLDSIQWMELFLLLEEEFGVAPTDEQLSPQSTLEALYQAVVTTIVDRDLARPAS